MSGRAQQLKRCDNNNKGEDYSPNTSNVNIYIYTWEKYVEYRFGAASGAFEKLVKRVFNKVLNIIITINDYNFVDISMLPIWVWKLESMLLRYPEIRTLSPVKASFNLEYQLELLCDQPQSGGKIQRSKHRIADH